MNKKEKEIILNQYELMLNISEAGMDKDDSIREFRCLLDKLDMMKERYTLENKLICKSKRYSLIVIDAFEMLFESFLKHGRLIKYDLGDVEEMLESARWDMDSEELNYNLKRISIIKDALSVNA